MGMGGHHQLPAQALWPIEGGSPLVWEKFMTKLIGAAALGIVLFGSIAATAADPDACPGASRTFKSAKNSVGDYLRRYASCVSRSNGHDKCSSEFSQLRSAQDDFESAVLSYDRECL
jgi:hypothetical protein